MLFRALALLMLSLVTVQAQEIRIAASDLLADCIRPSLSAYGEQQEMQIQVESIGSLPALDRLRSNEIDLAIIAVPAGEEVPRDEFRVYPFAYDAAVIAVNANNRLDELSVAWLGGIYGSNEEFNFTTWANMGLSGWGSRKIKPLAVQEGDSVSLELFKYSVLNSAEMKPAVAMVKDSEVEAILEADPSAIAIMPRLPESPKVKVLMVSSSEDAPAYGPSLDNIHFGDYPIRLSFYILFDRSAEERMHSLLKGLYEDVVASALQANDIFPLPSTVRRKLVMDLDLGQ